MKNVFLFIKACYFLKIQVLLLIMCIRQDRIKRILFYPENNFLFETTLYFPQIIPISSSLSLFLSEYLLFERCYDHAYVTRVKVGISRMILLRACGRRYGEPFTSEEKRAVRKCKLRNGRK